MDSLNIRFQFPCEIFAYQQGKSLFSHQLDSTLKLKLQLPFRLYFVFFYFFDELVSPLVLRVKNEIPSQVLPPHRHIVLIHQSFKRVWQLLIFLFCLTEVVSDSVSRYECRSWLPERLPLRLDRFIGIRIFVYRLLHLDVLRGVMSLKVWFCFVLIGWGIRFKCQVFTQSVNLCFFHLNYKFNCIY